MTAPVLPAAPAVAPRQVSASVLSVRKVGAYSELTLIAPGVAEQVRPGHFVGLSVGGPESSMLLRRAFSVFRAEGHGRFGGTLVLLVADSGPGTRWLLGRRVNDTVDLVGPLGRPFSLPRERVGTVLVGGGYGAAALFSLAEGLRGRGCRVDMVLGAADTPRLFGALDAKRMSATVAITTDDGSTGVRGRVTDVLPGVLARTGAQVVYACGPMAMLAAVAAQCTEAGVASQVAVEEAMACGIGICMTCVLPVRGEDGVTRMVRACVEGPVFRGDRLRFDALGSVPADATGELPPAPAPLEATTANPL